jgi:hypothetical protein
MFVLRSFVWLATVLMLLPPAADGEPAPRVNVIHAFYAARVLMQDVTGVCERNPEACATSKEALALVADKLETGAVIVSAGIAAGQALSDSSNHGTLTAADLEPVWSVADARP